MITTKEKVIVSILRKVLNFTVLGSRALEPITKYPIIKKELNIKTNYQKTKVVLHYPKEKINDILPIFVNFHASGFVFGSEQMDEKWCSYLSGRTNCIVANVDYPLAPENKFPIPLYDSYEVMCHLNKNHKELNIDQNYIAVGGHSAGGNIATGITFLAREKKDFQLCFQILDYPPLDLSISPNDRPKGDIPPFVAKIFSDMYPGAGNDPKNPLISPIYQKDMKDLPPALIITAENDPLRIEGYKYYENLLSAGNKAFHKQFKNAKHGFTHIGNYKDAEDAWNLMSDKLIEVFNQKR
eukprot:TRINITY_DN12450_c0_g1_i1.p1 TRINITY_DN12450_c0_g1~~TRINITY_DN12450_c0_g1_i1.p1  ORF type:complete len:297 (+),score=1.12 TRINITY_DN12450_c0_g1_i1:396-1286(+)